MFKIKFFSQLKYKKPKTVNFFDKENDRLINELCIDVQWFTKISIFAKMFKIKILSYNVVIELIVF